MDASQYKNYVLTMLFLKYISDKVKSDSDIFFDLPEGCSFNDIVALKGKTNIGEEIQKKLHAIARANPRLDHIINEADFDDSTKLGTGKAKVDTLTSLISVFQRDFLDFSKNRAGDDDLIGDAYEYLMKNFAAESGKKKGQFYTPAEVSRLMARLIGIHKIIGHRFLYMTRLAARDHCCFVLLRNIPSIVMAFLYLAKNLMGQHEVWRL